MSSASFDPVAADAIAEPSPSREELQEAIEQLMSFRDRIVSDVTGMGQKLKNAAAAGGLHTVPASRASEDRVRSGPAPAPDR